MRAYLYSICLSFALVTGCGSKPEESRTQDSSARYDSAATAMATSSSTFRITSSAFAPDGAIPKKHTCDGDDVSPELTWSDVPKGARSLALICDDPDAPNGTWVHWVLYNIPPNVTKLPEGITVKDASALGIASGTNDFGKPGYGGPCPPSGTHRYRFKLFALDTLPALPPGMNKAAVEEMTARHIVGAVELVGTYSR